MAIETADFDIKYRDITTRVFFAFENGKCKSISMPGLLPQQIDPERLDQYGKFLIRVHRKIPMARGRAYAKYNANAANNSGMGRTD
jgi:hypothetical protein